MIHRAPAIYAPSVIGRLYGSGIAAPVRSVVSWKLVVRSGRPSAITWQRPFSDYEDACAVWMRLIGLRHVERTEIGFRFPSTVLDGDLLYEFATVETFNSTPGGGTWTVPAGVTAVDYLVLAQGGGGGFDVGGGGGAGGYREATGFAVTPSATPTLTVGAGAGQGSTTVGAKGVTGASSVFSTITSLGGAGGGSSSSAAGGNGASGGGGRANGANAGGTGTAGQGNAGGAAIVGGGAGGGGGAGAVGGAGTAVLTGGAGGIGTASSITGSSVTRGGGGGGAGTGGNPAGAGGLGGGGAGSNSAGGSNGTANTGGGGGGDQASISGGNAGTGFVALSYTPSIALVFNMSMLGM